MAKSYTSCVAQFGENLQQKDKELLAQVYDDKKVDGSKNPALAAADELLDILKQERHALVKQIEISAKRYVNQKPKSEGATNEAPQQGKSNVTNAGSVSGAGSADIQGADSKATTGAVPRGKSGQRDPANGAADEVGATGNGSVRGSARPSSSYEIKDDLGKGGAKTKFKNNIAAIQEVKKGGQLDQSILVQYVGWGGMPQAFYRPDGSVAKGWTKEVKQLKELLTEEEYNQSRASTQNAHYTSKDIIDSMWEGVKRLGFKGGRVLEPSVGTGNFIGLIPRSLRAGTMFSAVELDGLTSKIAKGLYPTDSITNSGFQDYTVQDNAFTLAIGNPPFGSTPIFDKARPKLKFSIHNYFFAKSVDALQPSGVLAMVVSSGFMDAGNTKAREYIGAKAKLLGAIRLPNNAFSENANTEVTTDVIFLQKLMEGEEGNLSEWLGSGTINDTPINEYFVNNPENLLGEWGKHGSMFSPDTPALIAREGQKTRTLLGKAMNRLPEDVMGEDLSDYKADEVLVDDGDTRRLNTVYSEDGRLYKHALNETGEAIKVEVNSRYGAKGQVIELSDSDTKKINGMIKVAEAISALSHEQVQEGTTEERLTELRFVLNSQYDAFVKKFGHLNNDASKKLFEEDVRQPLLLSLEKVYDKGVTKAVADKTGEKVRKPSAVKADIFTKRTQTPYEAPTKAESAKDALLISLSEKGRVDMSYMESLLNSDEEAITQELNGKIFYDTQKGWVSREDYLSGNVKLKYQQTTNKAYKAELEKVLPADIEAIDISVKSGSSWLPKQVVKDFIDSLMGQTTATAIFLPHNSKWVITGTPTVRAAEKWGTARRNADQIISAAINQKVLEVRDSTGMGTQTVLNVDATNAANEKIEAVKEEWDNWVWQDEARRTELASIYNERFNVMAKRSFDGSHLELIGKVSDKIFKFRPHQKSGAWRVLQGGTTLFDHTVGTGKTATTIAAVMELRRTGMAKKPVIVVPNHLVQQWGKEFMELYPSASILLPTKQDFVAKKRKILTARMAVGDYDAIVIGHSQLTTIKNDPAFEAKFIKDQIRMIQDSIDLMKAESGDSSRTVKQAEKSRDTLAAKLAELNSLKKDDNLDMAQIGVDALFVDEAHEFKNLQYTTGLQRVGGLG